MTENASAHPPTSIYLTYKEGTLTVYIKHDSDDPNTHYIETVIVTVNRVEVLRETYTTQEVSAEKNLVTYYYTITASDRDVISVTAECNIEGSITETLIVGEDGSSKDNGTDDKKDYDKDKTKDEDSDNGVKASQDNENITLLLAAIAGVLIVIIILIALLMRKKKDTSKKDITKKGTTKMDKIKKEEWTSCPKCGTDLMMKDLSTHLNSVHPKSSKTKKEQITRRRPKQ
jgi:hypothetical protein